MLLSAHYLWVFILSLLGGMTGHGIARHHVSLTSRVGAFSIFIIIYIVKCQCEV